MAKRKAARAPRRRATQAKRASGARKAAGRRRTVKKAVKKPVKKAVKKAASRNRTAPKGRTAANTARKARKPAAPARAAKRTPARKRPAVKATKSARPKRTTTPSAATRKVVVRATAAPGARTRPPIPVLRKPPSLDRERRIARDEDEVIQGTPPSSLDLDRSASAVRTGRRVLKERYDEHTETSPALTGGDVDADWESAYSVGDEAPGGDNPTPDQDIVDDIGRAVGVEYQDNEELKGEEKIAKRDRNRWELDPASSDDWDDR
jgi:hypothetical protein